MKMLMIVCPEGRRDDMRALIARHDVHAYSEIENVTGEGETGKKLGSRVFPDRSALIFTVVSEEKEHELVSALRHCAAELYPGEGMSAFVLPAEKVI